MNWKIGDRVLVDSRQTDGLFYNEPGIVVGFEEGLIRRSLVVVKMGGREDDFVFYPHELRREKCASGSPNLGS